MTEQRSATFAHRDILLKRGGIISQREANKEYHEILKSNAVIYKFLPKVQRTDYAMLLFLFLRNVRKRRFIRYLKSDGTYRELEDERAAAVISAAIRDDKIVKAANQSNPLWLLGLHDPTNCHKGKPFVYRQADGSWAKLNSDEAKAVLCSEGSKNLLILPSGVDLCDSGEENIASSTPMVAAQQRQSSSQAATKGCTNLKRPLSQVSWLPSQISIDGDSSSVSAVSLEDNESTTMPNDDDCIGSPIKRPRSISIEDEAALLKEFEPSAPFDDDVAYTTNDEVGSGLLTGEDWAFLCNIFND